MLAMQRPVPMVPTAIAAVFSASSSTVKNTSVPMTMTGSI